MFFDRDEGEDLKRNISSLIKSCSKIYEQLIIDWDAVEDNIDKKSLIPDIDLMISSDYFFWENPILKELKYLEHYKRIKEYLKTRKKQNNDIEEKIKTEYRRVAIMAILIDSFAHNMSAHSLTALNWWFKRRAKIIDKVDQLKETGQNLEDNKDIPAMFLTSHPLSSSIQPMIKFLLEKGAFWTSLNREHNFGGISNNLYDVLWHNFICNPLYLGSIAFSEGIKKVNINVTIIEKSEIAENFGFERPKTIKKSDDGILLDGDLATIDLDHIYNPNEKAEETEQLHSEFVRLGSKHKVLKKELQQCNVFFPGGIAGYHAFFTILENEIRNVKHYNADALKAMKDEGLTLNISLEKAYLKGEAIPGRLYRIGVWLKYPLEVDYKLLTGRLESLSSDIINTNNKPKLGGIYQDKVCAAMLFNNNFLSAENKETDKDKNYYPWVKSGYGEILHNDIAKYTDWEVSWRRFSDGDDTDNRQNYIEKAFENGKIGYIKKFLHLWKGEFVKYIDEATDLGWENINRFKFITTPKENNEDVIKKVRDKDIIRIIQGHEDCTEIEAYQLWFEKWFGKNEMAVDFYIDNQNVGQIIANEEGVSYYNVDDLRGDIYKAKANKYSEYETFEMDFVHGKGKKIGGNEEKETYYYRSHGIFFVKFCGGLKPEYATMRSLLAAELLETINTKICIFDNRIANRVPTIYKKFYDKNWGLSIFEEEQSEWNRMRDNGFDKFHFLVVHLSFIEAFKDKHGQKKYSEKNIETFIENEILINSTIKEKAGENFILVITTGRGRSEWWENIKSTKHTKFVTFRPVEALIEAVESGISIGDDIEVKYNLTKVLFGS